MKRLLCVVVFTLCLSFPVLAGHTLPGDWCECGSFAACVCGPGEKPRDQGQRSVPDDSKQALGSETLMVLAVLLLVLRYKA